MKEKLIRLASRSKLIASKYAPEIMIGLGVVGVVATVVVAVKSKDKADEAVAAANEKINDVKDNNINGEISEEEYRKELTVAYAHKGITIVKSWGPTVALGTCSIALILCGAGVLKKRYVAVTAAYNVVNESFKEYRKRVIGELGKDADVFFRTGVRPEDKSKIVYDKENPHTGEIEKETIANAKCANAGIEGYSQYARFFDDGCSQWKKNAEYNLLFLRGIELEMNNRLKCNGHVFLNEVYDALGIPRSKEGAVVGWLLGKGGDNFIDFGIYNFYDEKARDFVNGYEPVVLLDFNVDGVIWDKI